MTHNDILRRLRYAFSYSNDNLVNIFSHAGEDVEQSQIRSWLLREDAEPLSDEKLCQFLDGLIIAKRGPNPSGTKPETLDKISRNEILKKLRIALALRDEDMMEVFRKANFTVTKAELGSFFRKEGQRNFAECPEQVLRKFIHGLGQDAS